MTGAGVSIVLLGKIGRNFLVCFGFLNALLIAPFAYALWSQPALIASFLPGKFAPALSPDLTGNMLFLALLLLFNALLLMIFGIGGTWHALWAGLRVSPKKMRWLLHERAGLASDIAGVVASAIQEEEKAEIMYLDKARGFLAVGLVLFALSLPALCIAYTAAAPNGAPIFETAGQTLANDTVTPDAIVRFTADQLGSLLLDIPAIFHLRATQMEVNGANILLGILVVLYRTLIGLGLILLYVGMRRARALLFYALEVAMPVTEIVAMEPVLQDGHGHADHAEHVEHVAHHHVHEEAPADHGHHDHGHHEPEPAAHEEAAEEAAGETLSEGDVVDIVDAEGVVHHAVVHDEAPAHHAEHAEHHAEHAEHAHAAPAEPVEHAEHAEHHAPEMHVTAVHHHEPEGGHAEEKAA